MSFMENSTLVDHNISGSKTQVLRGNRERLTKGESRIILFLSLESH